MPASRQAPARSQPDTSGGSCRAISPPPHPPSHTGRMGVLNWSFHLTLIQPPHGRTVQLVLCSIQPSPLMQGELHANHGGGRVQWTPIGHKIGRQRHCSHRKKVMYKLWGQQGAGKAAIQRAGRKWGSALAPTYWAKQKRPGDQRWPADKQIVGGAEEYSEKGCHFGFLGCLGIGNQLSWVGRGTGRAPTRVSEGGRNAVPRWGLGVTAGVRRLSRRPHSPDAGRNGKASNQASNQPDMPSRSRMSRHCCRGLSGEGRYAVMLCSVRGQAGASPRPCRALSRQAAATTEGRKPTNEGLSPALRARLTAVKAMTSNSWHLCSACRQARGGKQSEQEACLHAGRGCAKSATRSLLPATQPTPPQAQLTMRLQPRRSK